MRSSQPAARYRDAWNKAVRPPQRAHDEALAPRAPGPLDVDLIASVVVALSKGDDDGAILIFAPGAGEIDALCRHLKSALGEGAWVLPLHGGLPPNQQRKVFQDAIDRVNAEDA